MDVFCWFEIKMYEWLQKNSVSLFQKWLVKDFSKEHLPLTAVVVLSPSVYQADNYSLLIFCGFKNRLS